MKVLGDKGTTVGGKKLVEKDAKKIFIVVT